jgi:hypothetical protein
MRPILLFTFLLFFCIDAHAVMIKGLVKDAVSGEPLRAVVVQNINTGNTVYSDTAGIFFLMGKAGDVLSLRSLGYAAADKRLSVSDESDAVVIEMKRREIAIDTIVVESLTKYQQDSIDRRDIYGTAVDKRPVKFGIAKTHPLYGGGPKGAFTLNAPISSLIQKRTKKYKRLKAFQDRFNNGEKQAYMDSRYTPELVTQLTGLSGDSLSLFIKTFPIPYNFLRAATDLELKMQIKYNYRAWHTEPAKP